MDHKRRRSHTPTYVRIDEGNEAVRVGISPGTCVYYRGRSLRYTLPPAVRVLNYLEMKLAPCHIVEPGL